MLKEIDRFLHSITMYALLGLGLLLLAVISIVFSASDVLSFDWVNMVTSLLISVVVTIGVSVALSRLYRTTTTVGSPLITGLIVFFLVTPPSDAEGYMNLALISVFAAASKYVIAWKNRHLVNPAAVAVLLGSWLGILNASWWVASESLFIFTVILGFLVLRKLHRFELFFSFLVTLTATFLVTTMDDSRSISTTLRDTMVSFPAMFLGAVMLTEPMTTAPGRNRQIIYGAIVGVVFGLAGTGWHYERVFFTPEFALIIGNLVMFLWYPQKTWRLSLKQKKRLSENIYSYEFESDKPVHFTPGQYADVTLAGIKSDSRGNRRSFSFASSPSDSTVLFGVKHNKPTSMFKSYMRGLKPGDEMLMHYISGDFVMPKSTEEKLLFIAGGIGVTPFRSMLESYSESNEKRDIAFFYQVRDIKELVFKSTVQKAIKAGVKCVPVLSSKQIPKSYKGEKGFINEDMLTRHAEDFRDRKIYISGPPPMVNAYKKLLRKLGVPRKNIITDYFSGY